MGATMSASVEPLRWFYARMVVPEAESAGGERLIRAFATVPRERFVGPGPWQVITASGYIDTPSDDPAFLYQDVVVALAAKRGVNNGQPSLHATSIAAANPRPGETVLHIGGGTGYYTAILATLVGSTGKVIAREIDPELAERATTNLADYANVVVECRSGTQGTIPLADVVYVSAAATTPLKMWLDALRPCGRLIFPLTPSDGVGGMLLVTRNDNGPFSAKFVSAAVFIPCIGARDQRTAEALTEAFRCRGTGSVERLHIQTPPDETCWFAGDGWWLSTRS
jgi:protein-L-isoaspartate(D-aspartate) O-methyltransferase